MNPLTKFLTIYAVVLIMLAFAWPFITFLPIGYLPGDVTTQLGGLTLYLAFGTGLVVSAIVAFLLYIFQRY